MIRLSRPPGYGQHLMIPLDWIYIPFSPDGVAQRWRVQDIVRCAYEETREKTSSMDSWTCHHTKRSRNNISIGFRMAPRIPPRARSTADSLKDLSGDLSKSENPPGRPTPRSSLGGDTATHSPNHHRHWGLDPL